MYILYSFSITIIGDSPFFSLSSHGIRAKGEKNPNYFWFIRESILGNLSVTVFHSGHPSHLLKLSDQPYRRQKSLTACDLFRRSPFPTPTIPSGAQGGDLQLFSKHQRKNPKHTPATHVSSPAAWISRTGAWGRVRHFPTTRFHLQPHLTPSSHPPSLLVSFEPWKCIFCGFFVSAGPLNSLSNDLRWLPLHPEPCTCLRKSAISRIRALFDPNVFHSLDK